ncbi:MAG: transposase [Anaerolineales bacterium]|nr:transposase [Anaerolineales bacterium]
MSAVDYQETIWSQLFAGNQHTVNCLPHAMQGVQSSLALAQKQRKRTVWRFDGGGGSEANFRLLLQQGYHVHAKGLSSSRAAALAKCVTRWDAYEDVWFGEVKTAFNWGHPLRVFVQRRLKNDQVLHSYYVSTLTLPAKKGFLTLYQERGGAEVEQFRQDKSGLAMAVRRKSSFNGQSAYILLTDLAHNLLADFKRHALLGSRFETYGLKRIIRDLLCFPGTLTFDDEGKLVYVNLLRQMKNSTDLLFCLERYCLERFA